jgi:release factor glutamine methyltransferase
MATGDARPDTPLELVKLTSRYFSEKALPSPRLEAEILLAHVLGIERLGLYLNFDKPLTSKEIDSYRELVRRRVLREPTAYLTGTREFWSLDFKVGPGVLIPRPDTELLVERGLELMDAAGPGTLLELGPGTGAICIALLTERAKWRAVGVEISAGALEYARANSAAHGVEERLGLRHGDLFEPVAGEHFDLIVTNPPYIPSDDISGLMSDVREFEPSIALDGGPDGLDVIRRIAAEAPEHLNPGGALLIEFGVGQEQGVESILSKTGRYGQITIENDLTGRPRAACAKI